MAGERQQQEEEATAGAGAGAGASALHLVVFPWLAFGHLIQFLELSKRLAARGHAVTFVSTARNVARLPQVPAALSARVRTVALSLPAVDGLPEGAESTADVPPDKVELLKTAFDGLAAPFADFLAAACAADGQRGGEHAVAAFARRPDWVVADFAHYWLCPIAEQHKVMSRPVVRGAVCTAVRRVMVVEGEEGKMLALNARKLREEVVGGDAGRQERYVDELVNCLQRLRFTE